MDSQDKPLILKEMEKPYKTYSIKGFRNQDGQP